MIKFFLDGNEIDIISLKQLSNYANQYIQLIDIDLENLSFYFMSNNYNFIAN